jgi:hypothetical protein
MSDSEVAHTDPQPAEMQEAKGEEGVARCSIGC